MNTAAIFFAFVVGVAAAAPRQLLFGGPAPDVDECAVNMGGCSHCCTNYDYLVSEFSYKCSCPLGYEMTADEHTCVMVDGCATYGCSDFCEQAAGAFACVPAPEPVCSCPGPCTDEELTVPAGGYTLGPDMKTCFDVDECSAAGWAGVCRGTCDNTPGCYECISADVETDYKMSLTLIMHDYSIGYYTESTFKSLVAQELTIEEQYVTIDSALQVGADTEISFTWFAVDATNFVILIQHVETIDWEAFLLEYMRDTLPAAGGD